MLPAGCIIFKTRVKLQNEFVPNPVNPGSTSISFPAGVYYDQNLAPFANKKQAYDVTPSGFKKMSFTVKNSLNADSSLDANPKYQM